MDLRRRSGRPAVFLRANTWHDVAYGIILPPHGAFAALFVVSRVVVVAHRGLAGEGQPDSACWHARPRR